MPNIPKVGDEVLYVGNNTYYDFGQTYVYGKPYFSIEFYSAGKLKSGPIKSFDASIYNILISENYNQYKQNDTTYRILKQNGQWPLDIQSDPIMQFANRTDSQWVIRGDTIVFTNLESNTTRKWNPKFKLNE